MERGDVATLHVAANLDLLGLTDFDRFIQGEHIGRNERCVAQEVDTTVLFK